MFTKAQSTEVNIPPRSNIEPIDLPTVFYTCIHTLVQLNLGDTILYWPPYRILCTWLWSLFVTCINNIICSHSLDNGWAGTVCMVTAHCPCNVCHWVCACARGLVCTLQLIRYSYGPPSCQLCTFLWVSVLWPTLYTFSTDNTLTKRYVVCVECSIA